MSLTLQPTPTKIQQNNYMALAVITAVGYDYILTFSNEIEYIWNKPWTWVSMLFVFIRYLGLYSAAISSLEKSSFLPGSQKICEIIYVMDVWTFPLFLGAADLAMILRVWAIFNRSRLILSTLLMLLSLTIIFAVLATSIDDKRVEHFVIDQILDISICEGDPVAHTWISVAAILQIMEGVAMFSLVILQFVQQSLHMYRMTKRWEINRYMNLLVKQGALYFLATFCFSLINVLNASGKLPAGGWQKIPLYILEVVPIYTLTPRFIMGLKEVYARDVQGRHWSRINTVFGLWLSDHDVDGAAVELTDIERNDGLVGVEESPTATRTSAGTS